MENASKALIMAAGILIAILTMTVIAVLVSTFSEYGEAYERNIATQEIQEFNTQFTKYMRTDKELKEENKYLKIHDVLTIANLAVEWDNTGMTNEFIQVCIDGIEQITLDSGTYKSKIDYEYLSDNDLDPADSTKWKKYYISSYTLDDTTGRIKAINIATGDKP